MIGMSSESIASSIHASSGADLFAAKDPVERIAKPSHLGERIRSLLQDIDLFDLSLCQKVSRLDAQRGGIHWRDCMTGFRISNRLRLQRGGRHFIGLPPFGPPPSGIVALTARQLAYAILRHDPNRS